MNSSTISLCAIFSVLIVLCYGQQKKAQDIEGLLEDRQFVRKQINCVLGKARCDNFGKNLRAALPRVVNGNCKSCTPEESEVAKKIISFMKANHPDVWDNVLRKYSKTS